MTTDKPNNTQQGDGLTYSTDDTFERVVMDAIEKGTLKEAGTPMPAQPAQEVEEDTGLTYTTDDTFQRVVMHAIESGTLKEASTPMPPPPHGYTVVLTGMGAVVVYAGHVEVSEPDYAEYVNEISELTSAFSEQQREKARVAVLGGDPWENIILDDTEVEEDDM